MDMKLTDEQVQLQDGARRFMDEHCAPDFVREMEASELGFSRTMWKQMAEMGWLGIDLPIEQGGLGLGSLDLALLMKELGRHLCPVPMVSTVVIAGEAIARAGTEEQRRYLEQIVDGELVIAFAYQEFTRSFAPGDVELEARASNDGFVLSGTKMFVEYAGGADLLLVVARTSEEALPGSGLTLFLVDAKAQGIACKHTPAGATSSPHSTRECSLSPLSPTVRASSSTSVPPNSPRRGYSSGAPSVSCRRFRDISPS
jgi:alkylation response protein AidB-like acyl-CoA dehydrogenase